MAAKTKPMSQIKEIFRLHHKGNSIKGRARLCRISKNTVRKYLSLLSAQPLSVEAILDIPEPVLDHQLSSMKLPAQDSVNQLDHLDDQAAYFERESKRPGVNKWLLWSVYRHNTPTGYSYSQFCFYLQSIDKRRKL